MEPLVNIEIVVYYDLYACLQESLACQATSQFNTKLLFPNVIEVFQKTLFS